jgi:2-amino-4-hydroxy-6-hydroxymethyldihydropteridine diphosphokinase
MRHSAFVGLGSNLDDPYRQLQRAFLALADLPDTSVKARSSLYRSAPLGYADQPDFLNAVAEIETGLSARALLAALLDIEHRHGRERTFRNAPRTLDMDILLYGNLRLHEHGLTIPHPQMHLRAFVLLPLLEIAPDVVIPAIGSAQEALLACRDQALERFADAV